jgi:hypothetical protein
LLTPSAKLLAHPDNPRFGVCINMRLNGWDFEEQRAEALPKFLLFKLFCLLHIFLWMTNFRLNRLFEK